MAEKSVNLAESCIRPSALTPRRRSKVPCELLLAHITEMGYHLATLSAPLEAAPLEAAGEDVFTLTCIPFPQGGGERLPQSHGTHTHIHTYIPTDLQTYRPTGLETYRPTGLQTYTPTDL